MGTADPDGYAAPSLRRSAAATTSRVPGGPDGTPRRQAAHRLWRQAGSQERSPDRDLSIEYAVIADLKPPATKNSVPKTIEDRLVEKAAAADHRD